MVLLVHGLPGSHRDWRYLAACLDGFRVVRLDMPGFGGSTDCGQAPDFDERARFVIDVIATLELTDPVVMGHSMGGPIAAMVANRLQGQVRAVGLIASPGLRRHRGAPNRVAQAVARLAAFPPLAWLIQRPLERAFRVAGFPSSLTHAGRVAAIRQVSTYDPARVAKEMRALTVPTLVAFADDDALVEPEIGEELAQGCPAGPRLHFSTGGHNIQKTQCEALARSLREWLLAPSATP